MFSDCSWAFFLEALGIVCSGGTSSLISYLDSVCPRQVNGMHAQFSYRPGSPETAAIPRLGDMTCQSLFEHEVIAINLHPVHLGQSEQDFFQFPRAESRRLWRAFQDLSTSESPAHFQWKPFLRRVDTWVFTRSQPQLNMNINNTNQDIRKTNTFRHICATPLCVNLTKLVVRAERYRAQ